MTSDFRLTPADRERSCRFVRLLGATRCPKKARMHSGNCSPLKKPKVKPRVNHGQLRRTDMDKDRVEGAAHRIKGAVKEVVGKVTGDAKTQTEGAAEKAAGKVQNAAGGAKDAIRESLKK
jgi:uncharacterized protein YjbJ (UPF0337 family)